MTDKPCSCGSSVGLLVAVCRSIRRHLAATMCEHKLHPGQEAVLRAVRSHDLASQTDLASQLGISSASMTGLLQRLESAGLVVRERKRDDRREVLISLTASGKAAAARADAAWQAFDREIRSVLSDTEVEQLRRLLHRLVGTLRPMCTGASGRS